MKFNSDYELYNLTQNSVFQYIRGLDQNVRLQGARSSINHGVPMGRDDCF